MTMDQIPQLMSLEDRAKMTRGAMERGGSRVAVVLVSIRPDGAGRVATSISLPSPPKVLEAFAGAMRQKAEDLDPRPAVGRACDLVRLIARLTHREDEGATPPGECDPDDAADTLDNLISRARDIVALGEPTE